MRNVIKLMREYIIDTTMPIWVKVQIDDDGRPTITNVTLFDEHIDLRAAGTKVLAADSPYVEIDEPAEVEDAIAAAEAFNEDWPYPGLGA